jgi:hypothetical protein
VGDFYKIPFPRNDSWGMLRFSSGHKDSCALRKADFYRQRFFILRLGGFFDFFVSAERKFRNPAVLYFLLNPGIVNCLGVQLIINVVSGFKVAKELLLPLLLNPPIPII